MTARALLSEAELEAALVELDGWTMVDGKFHKEFEFDDFVALMTFVNRMAELAEEEGHHPDFCVHYSKLDVSIWTHAIGGLSQNDFILAAKVDALRS